MKSVFNIFIFLAISAFVAEIAYSFIEKTSSETSMKVDDSDVDDENDSDQEEKNDSDKLELYYSVGSHYSYQLAFQNKKSFFGHIQHSTGFNFSKPPYSPPELM